MKQLITILALTIAITSCGQSKKERDVLANTRLLETTVFKTKDSTTIEKLFAKNMTYGHSSGKIQNREEAIQGIIHNGSTYDTKDVVEAISTKVYDDSIVVKHNFKATENKADGSKGDLNLVIELAWIKEGSDWKLLRRQASKGQLFLKTTSKE